MRKIVSVFPEDPTSDPPLSGVEGNGQINKLSRYSNSNDSVDLLSLRGTFELAERLNSFSHWSLDLQSNASTPRSKATWETDYNNVWENTCLLNTCAFESQYNVS